MTAFLKVLRNMTASDILALINFWIAFSYANKRFGLFDFDFRKEDDEPKNKKRLKTFRFIICYIVIFLVLTAIRLAIFGKGYLY